MSIDFDGLSARLILQLRELLPEWYPEGKFFGSEFCVGDVLGTASRKGRGSFSINLERGTGKDFATGESFSDPIAIYAGLHGLPMGEAARQLGADERPVIEPSRANGNGMFHVEHPDANPALPAPIDYPAPRDHFEFGRPVAIYAYYDADPDHGPLFLVCRYEPAGQRKQFCPMTWRNNAWVFKGHPEPRPMYRLRELLEFPLQPVVVVEGEKAAEALASSLPTHCVVTWSGGAQAVAKTDWAPLLGREVTIWPDADIPGAEAGAKLAAILLKHGVTPRVMRVAGVTIGWDAADAIQERWSPGRLSAFIESSAKPIESAKVIPIRETDVPRGTKRLPKQLGSTHAEVGSSVFVSWESIGLDCNSAGIPHPTLANTSLVIQKHPELTRKIWFDTFRGKVFRVVDGVDRQWTDNDDLDMTVWIQQSMRLPKISLGTVRDAVIHAARQNSKHSLRQYLETLAWDGRPRLNDWLHDCLGVDRTPYTTAIARNWPIALIARAFRPGCQMDNMPVLEGRMGKGKSTFLEMLTAPWYASLPDEFGSKDFLQAIQGCWMIEVPDMTGFSKREHTHILAIITQRNDRYRATWGRHVEDHPRVSIFGATSETDDYLQDARGRRRYWPLRCLSIDLEALSTSRDQIFAEAVVRFRQKATWYQMPDDETLLEQDERVTRDPWQRKIEIFCSAASEVNVESILSSSECIGMPGDRQTRREVLRVTAILREMGWRRAWPKDKDGKTRAVWIPPTPPFPVT